MQKKLTIGGQVADTAYNLRTTDFILSTFMEEAIEKNTSVNVLFNKTLFSKAKQLKSKTKHSKAKQ